MACKNLNRPSLILIAIILATISPYILDRVNASDPIYTICGRTSHPDLCLKIVAADNRANLRFSLKGVATILKDGALSVSVATSAKIPDLLKSATNSRVIENLKSCSEGYSKAISRLRSANFTVINRETFPSLVDAISGAAKEGPTNCEGLFQKPPPFPSPLTADNQKLVDVCEVTLDLIAACGNNGCDTLF